MMKNYRIIVMAIAVVVSTACNQGNQQETNAGTGSDTKQEKLQGSQLFGQNCVSCHSIKTDLVGPALAGVEGRWKDKQLLYSYIKNSQQVIKEDEYARKLYEKYNRSIMPPFPNLQDADIELILAYIQTESSK